MQKGVNKQSERGKWPVSSVYCEQKSIASVDQQYLVVQSS